MKKVISTNNAPQPVGPYSQAIKTENWLFLSGQIALNKENVFIDGDISAQTLQVMKNLKAVLNEAGLDFNNVVKTIIYLVDLNDFQVVNKIYGSYLANKAPARSTVQVAALPLGAKIEIEMIAKSEISGENH